MKRPIFSLLALAALAPQMRAQTIFNYTDFGAQCTPGLLVACSSLEIWNEVIHETGEIYFGVRVSNLQGTPGFQDLESAGLNALIFNNLRVGPTEYPAAAGNNGLSGQLGTLSGTASNCTVSGQCNDRGVGDHPELNLTSGGLWRLVLHIGSGGQYLWGCDPINFGGAMVSTCGGHLTWRLRPMVSWDPTAGAFALLPTQQTSALFGYTSEALSPSCTTGIDCVTVTPEPATLLLLATGLVGVGVVTRRRRKLDA